LSRLALFWEGLWPALWPILLLAGLFACLALLGVWQNLSPWFHLAGLIGFAATFVLISVFAVQGLRFPGRRSAIRRLERDSGLSHQPLSALNDVPAFERNVDPGTQRLWQAHRDWLEKQLASLRFTLPSPRLIERDPYGLRVVIVLALIVCASFAGKERFDRLAEAFDTRLDDVDAGTAHLDAWVTPPAHIHRPPLFLTRQKSMQAIEREEIDVPRGSVLTVRVDGPGPEPKVAGANKGAFVRQESGRYDLNLTLLKDGKISITRGRQRLKEWTFKLGSDKAPAIVLENLQITAQKSLRIAYRVNDDYGVVQTRLHLALADDSAIPLDEAPNVLPLPLSAEFVTDRSEIAFKDLTTHPWAGHKVRLELSAVDAIGQIGRSQIHEIMLPEREFRIPLAKAIIEEMQLLENRENVGRVARILDTLTRRPEGFIEDTIAYLGLRAAYWRLHHGGEKENLKAIQALLWDVAIRLEDGSLGDTERELRALQEELMAALMRNAPAEQIEQLVEALRQAMLRHLEALSRNSSEATQTFQSGSGIEVDSADLDDFLDMITQMAQSGAFEKARDMLSSLQNILENLQAAGPASGRDKIAGQLLEDMSDLIGDERKLLDDTYRIDQQGRAVSLAPEFPLEFRPGQSLEGEPQAPLGQPAQSQKTVTRGLQQLVNPQDRLRTQLGSLMGKLRKLGDVSPAFGRARDAMAQAASALRKGNAEEAMKLEREAIEQMRAGAQAAARQLLDNMMQAERTQSGPGSYTDPLGRPLNGMGMLGEGTEVPDKSDLQRAREILDELRTRAGEAGRSLDELEYIDRLLDRF
jgi:uncharacterized protein (TIGR02302 family)